MLLSLDDDYVGWLLQETQLGNNANVSSASIYVFFFFCLLFFVFSFSQTCVAAVPVSMETAAKASAGRMENQRTRVSVRKDMRVRGAIRSY